MSSVSRRIEIPLGVSLVADPFRHTITLVLDILRTIVYFIYIILLLPTISDVSVDLVHAHFLLPQGLAGALVARVKNAPLVLTAEGADVNLFMTHFLPRMLARHVLFRSSRCVIAVSQPLLDKLRSIGCGNAVYIPNSVDVPTPLEGMGAQLIRRQNGILFVGELIPEKKPDILIQAFSKVADQVADATLTIAGTGPMSELLQEMTFRLGLTKRIRLVGYLQQEQLAKLYRESSVFVLPSSSEGMSLAMLEAMSFGMCVIVSEPAQSGVIRDKVDGLVSRLGDAEDLADKILSLLENPEYMLKLSKNAFMKCRQEYSLAVVGPRLEGVYRQACSACS